MPRELTDRQQRFVEEYLVDLNATRAAARAGYSEHTAHEIGRQLLGKTWVADAVAEAIEERSKRTAVNADRVVRELARIAFADMRRFAKVSLGGGVDLIPSDEWTDDDAAAVAELSQTTTDSGGSVRFKLHDKKPALEALAKHTGVYQDGQVNVSTQIVVTD